MKILSIDFDYFVDTTKEVRDNYFPKAEDITDPIQIESMWSDCYREHEELKKIGAIRDFSILSKFLEEHRKDIPTLVAESHKDIYNFIKEVQRHSDTCLEIVNIDYHHDNYYMYGGQVTCANWLMKICEEVECDVMWIRREDSETESLAGSFPYKMSTDIRDCFKEYDAIFLCMSPEWVPPHLRSVFNILKGCIM